MSGGKRNEQAHVIRLGMCVLLMGVQTKSVENKKLYTLRFLVYQMNYLPYKALTTPIYENCFEQIDEDEDRSDGKDNKNVDIIKDKLFLFFFPVEKKKFFYRPDLSCLQFFFLLFIPYETWVIQTHWDIFFAIFLCVQNSVKADKIRKFSWYWNEAGVSTVLFFIG